MSNYMDEKNTLLCRQLEAFNMMSVRMGLDAYAYRLYVVLLCRCSVGTGLMLLCEVFNDELMKETGMESHTRFCRARKTLVDKGLLRYLRGSSKRPPVYRLNFIGR